MELPENTKTWHTSVDKSGRVLLPAPLRRALHANPGTELIWTMTDDVLRLQPFDKLLSSIQNYFRSLAAEDEVWSDELLAERRKEAVDEQRS